MNPKFTQISNSTKNSSIYFIVSCAAALILCCPDTVFAAGGLGDLSKIDPASITNEIKDPINKIVPYFIAGGGLTGVMIRAGDWRQRVEGAAGGVVSTGVFWLIIKMWMGL